MNRPARLCVMLSGGGRTLLNLVEHIREGNVLASIELVIASRECGGAERAREAGLAVQVIEGEIAPGRLGGLLEEHRIDLVVLAGYLRLVNIPEAFRGRILNIHPALLPDFGGPGMYGPRVHEAVLASGSSRSGCTVHVVDERYDRGPILLQKFCTVEPGDTPETLAARVFALEREAYPEALRAMIARLPDLAPVQPTPPSRR